MRTPSLILLCSLSFAACESPDTDPIGVVLGTGAPLGFVSLLAMDAARGEPAACASVASTCDVFPCAADVDIAIGDACPMPIGDGLSGTVHVTGAWSDASNAILGVDVSEVEGLRFEGAAGLIVDDDGERVDVIWAMEGVEIDEGAEDEVDVGQSAITIRVERGAESGFDDDVIDLNGVQQVVKDDVITQVTVTGATFTSACRANPTAGEAVMQRVDSDGSDVSVVAVEFHASCDGRAAPLVDAVDIPFVDETVAIALTE